MAGSDCELIGTGWLAQPANTWSSGAYLLAAAFVIIRRRRAGSAPALLLLAGAVALGFVSLGSSAYHGPQPSWARAAHDCSIAALLLVLVLRGAAGRPGSEQGRIYLVGAGALAAVITLVLAVPALTLLAHTALSIALLVTVLGRRRGSGAKPAGAHRLAVAALGLGLVLYLAGRTGGPLCSPTSPLQAHAGWHILTAVAAAAFLAQSDGAVGRQRAPR
jgi:hypothetical protein